ncbi:hypothetical protein PRIPAC_90178 [Pristionchus pacificus]|uniref:Membrane transporter n=1 Tax=Pristionchus pacificus TaxID=54126 RepID=A0A2A6B9L2_PRIPA|nr:hypothetical protein PRIPAC_90178 [Pristionchus pacificus]|eukprot:PDM62558.1 membrane transporter [Pristionchus pacificus]
MGNKTVDDNYVPDDYRNPSIDILSEVEESRAAKTHWKDIYLVSVFYFFAYVTYQALMIPLYSYLKKLDGDASIEFYGFITSAFKMVPVAYRKYLVLLVFVLHSTAEGSLIIVRSYVPRISTPADRSAAYGVKNGAVLLSVVAGPLIQLVFSSIPWPKDGVVIMDPYFKLNQFTGTIWLLLIFNILAFYLVVVHIREPSDMEGEEEDKPGYYNLIVMLLLEKSISGGGFAALLTIINPYVTTTFNFSNGHALYIVTVASVGVGIFSIAVVGLFIFAKLGTIIPASRSFPISLLLCLTMFILSYPLPLISSQVPVKSAENPHGCDASVYAWCESLFMNPKFLWLGMVAVLTGTAMPFSLISQDTIYSRVLEGLDQVGAKTRKSFCFTRWSPAGFWSGCAVVMVIALALWVPVYRKLRVRGI